MNTMTAGFLQNALTVVVNLKTSMVVVCVAKTPTDIYLDFLPWLWAMSLRLSLKVCATFMDADCCSENVVWGALWSLSWYFVFHYFVFCPKFHRLHPRPHYFFLGRLKDAVLLNWESALIEFFYRFFQHNYIILFQTTHIKRWKTIWKQPHMSIYVSISEFAFLKSWFFHLISVISSHDNIYYLTMNPYCPGSAGSSANRGGPG